MRRRHFITLLGGAAAWPLAARAQRERMRRIGVLMTLAAGDQIGEARIASLAQGLQQLGWTIGRNVQVDVRWSGAAADEVRRSAAELVATAPEIIVANGNAALAPLLQVTRSVPIVFTIVPDPVGGGFVDSLARPGGNATGFMGFEYSLGAKWLELLKEIASATTRVAVLRDPSLASGPGLFAAIQTAAPSLGVELTPINIRDAASVERDFAAFAGSPNRGLIVTGSALTLHYRDAIIAQAARYNLPAVYFERFWVTAGGLISYGPDYLDQYRLAAGYVDRILKGEKPADLPVQAPNKYDLAINLKTAKTLGITVPDGLLARADEVIE